MAALVLLSLLTGFASGALKVKSNPPSVEFHKPKAGKAEFKVNE